MKWKFGPLPARGGTWYQWLGISCRPWERWQPVLLSWHNLCSTYAKRLMRYQTPLSFSWVVSCDMPSFLILKTIESMKNQSLATRKNQSFLPHTLQSVDQSNLWIGYLWSIQLTIWFALFSSKVRHTHRRENQAIHGVRRWGATHSYRAVLNTWKLVANTYSTSTQGSSTSKNTHKPFVNVVMTISKT